MLTLDLVRYRENNLELVPRYIDTTNKRLQQLAKEIIQIFTEHQGKTRQELSGNLDIFFKRNREVIILKGFRKLLEDRSEFMVGMALEPQVLRQEVFSLASQMHYEGNFSKESILQQVSDQVNLTCEEIEDNLFADLKENQILQDFPSISPEMLLIRYNTSLAQAILFKAIKLEIEIQEPDYKRYRQLFRAIKFYRLLYRIRCPEKNIFRITLDGPMSIFHGSQKYGLQMAIFFPSLLLCQDWRMKATLRWGKAGKERYFCLSDKVNLKSHYQDIGIFIPPEHEKFANRFGEIDSEWKMEECTQILEVGNQEICIPDYTFVHTSGQRIHLEIFGFWYKSALQRRLEQISKLEEKIIVAVSKSMKLEKETSQLENKYVYLYRQVIVPKDILAMLNQQLIKTA